MILAAGLRHPRVPALPLAPGTVVYEIDQPAVIKFKAGPRQSERRTRKRRTAHVAVDLPKRWPTALKNAGDPARPTAFSAEFAELLPHKGRTACSMRLPRSAPLTTGWPPRAHWCSRPGRKGEKKLRSKEIRGRGMAAGTRL